MYEWWPPCCRWSSLSYFSLRCHICYRSRKIIISCASLPQTPWDDKPGRADHSRPQNAATAAELKNEYVNSVTVCRSRNSSVTCTRKHKINPLAVTEAHTSRLRRGGGHNRLLDYPFIRRRGHYGPVNPHLHWTKSRDHRANSAFGEFRAQNRAESFFLSGSRVPRPNPSQLCALLSSWWRI